MAIGLEGGWRADLRPLAEYRPLARLVVIGVCVLWFVAPILGRDNAAPDGQAFLAAGRLAPTAPELAYPTEAADGTSLLLSPRYTQASCAVHPSSTCAAEAVPFVSPPTVLPIVDVLARLDGVGGLLVLRLLGASCLVAGMACLWCRYAGVDPRWPLGLAGAAIMLTPLAFATLDAGQVTPILFVLACASPVVFASLLGVALGGGLAVAVAFKLFPAAALGVLAHQRRWLGLASATAATVVLSVLALGRYGTDIVRPFLDGVRAMDANELRSHYGTSIDALLHALVGSWSTSSPLALGFLVARALGVGIVLLLVARRAGVDVEWALLWVGVLVVLPLTHDHYFVVLVPAAAAVVHRTSRSPAWIVAAAAATAPFPVLQTTAVYYGPVLAVVAFGALACASWRAPGDVRSSAHG